MRNYMLLLATLFCISGNSWGLALTQTGKTETLSTSPLITIQHCWTGGNVYDVDVTIALPEKSSTVTLEFPDVETQPLGSNNAEALGSTTGRRVSNMFSLGYGNGGSITPPSIVIDEGTAPSVISDHVVLKPGQKHRFRMKFPLPPLKLINNIGAVANPADVPKTISLFVDMDWIGGCGEDAISIKQYPFCNRDQLIKLGTRAE